MRTDQRPVLLRGGPMDGWVVKANAPVLQPDWVPFSQVREGQYSSPVEEDGLLVAEWVPD